MLNLRVNGKTYQVDAEPGTPLLWVLRDTLGLTGTKYGCGIAQCGACTVHVNGRATRSCVLPVSSVICRCSATGAGVKSISPFPMRTAAVGPVPAVAKNTSPSSSRIEMSSAVMTRFFARNWVVSSSVR